MVFGCEVYIDDLLLELLIQLQDSVLVVNWEQVFCQWVDQVLGCGQLNLLDSVVLVFEWIMIEIVFKYIVGCCCDVVVLFGWGCNILICKIKELGMNVDGVDDEGDD